MTSRELAEAIHELVKAEIRLNNALTHPVIDGLSAIQMREKLTPYADLVEESLRAVADGLRDLDQRKGVYAAEKPTNNQKEQNDR